MAVCRGWDANGRQGASRMKKLLLISLTALIAASPATARTHATHAGSHAKSHALKWMDGPPGLPAGAKFAVISGDPGKDGMFTIRAKLPANYAVPPHHHPTDEKVSV